MYEVSCLGSGPTLGEREFNAVFLLDLGLCTESKAEQMRSWSTTGGSTSTWAMHSARLPQMKEGFRVYECWACRSGLRALHRDWRFEGLGVGCQWSESTLQLL